MPEIPGVTWHRVDLLGDDRLEELVAELAPEQLVHLAWHTEHARVLRAPENVIWVERSLRLMRAFVGGGGRRVVMLGTCAEYDWSASSQPLSESRSSLAAANLYGASKDALRRVARAYAQQEGIEFAWGRPFFLYGPREGAARLVPAVTRSLLMGEPAAISSGEQVRDYMHVDDLAGAVIALLESRVLGEVNLATGIGVPVGEVVDRIAQLVGRPELVHRGALPDRPWEPPVLVADVGRLRDQVGYRPRFTLAEGLAETTRWWEGQLKAPCRPRR
jgi:nucleoside-diphosphate-sugar epimerase